jgi:hypothetical protein
MDASRALSVHAKRPGLSLMHSWFWGEPTAGPEADWYLLQCGHFAWLKPGAQLERAGGPPVTTVICETCEPDYGYASSGGS